MKYRVSLDLSFENETDARALMNYAKRASKKALSVREGEANEEIAFCNLEICRHDEGLPCEKLERIEIRKLLPG